MARPGPDPRGEGGESWLYYVNATPRRKPLMDLPPHRGEDLDPETGSSLPIAWHEQTLAWWKVVKSMPHTVDWALGDWAFAVSTAYVADQSFSTGSASSFIELRQREGALGLTAEARRKLRIKWVTKEEYATLMGESLPEKKDTKTTAPANIHQLDDRRKRSVG